MICVWPRKRMKIDMTDPEHVRRAIAIAQDHQQISLSAARKLPREYLNHAKAYGIRTPGNVEVLTQELSRRQEWEKPAGRAVWISTIALLVSLATAAVTFIKPGPRVAGGNLDTSPVHHQGLGVADESRPVDCSAASEKC